MNVSELKSVEPKVLWRYLERSVEKYPEKDVLVYENQRISYRKLNETVDILAKGFLESGIKRGDRIQAIIPPRPEFMYCYLAAAKIGAILVGTNTRYRESELEHMINNAKPAIIVMLNKFENDEWDASLILRPLLPRLQGVKNYIVIGESDFPDAISFDEFISKTRPELDKELIQRKQEVEENDGIFIVYTSGTTGTPKGAIMTHKNIATSLIDQTERWGLTEDERLLSHVPLCHVGGANINVMGTLMIGATCVLMDHFKARDALKMVGKEKITIMPQVPTMWLLELKLDDFDSYDLSSLRIALIGGSSVPPEMVREIQKRVAPIDVIDGYGITEGSGYVGSTALSDSPEQIATSVGTAFSSLEMKIVDENRKEVERGVVGEIAIRGDAVVKEYFAMPRESEASFDKDGWFFTVDMGVMDKDGRVSIVGRKKEMYLSGGYNIYPREIEEMLMKHPKVVTAAIIGVNDPIFGEIGRAYVIPRENATVTEDELKEYLYGKIANYKVPKQFRFRETLPMTPLQKINKSKLIEESKNE